MNAPERVVRFDPGMPAEVARVERLLVLQGSDLNEVVTRRERFAQTQLLFIDPGLLDDAAMRGLPNLRFVPLDTDPDFQARAASEALSLATLVDLRLSRLRASIWPGARLQGWDVALFQLPLQRLHVSRELGRAFAAAWDGSRLALLRPAAVQRMYFDSSLSADLFTEGAPGLFEPAGAYEAVLHSPAAPLASVLDAGLLRQAMAGGHVTLLTHLPTCYYDRDWLARQISRAHRFTLDLPSPYWDVPVHRGASPVVATERADRAHLAQAQRYAEQAREVLEETLGHLMREPQARAAQLDEWSTRCCWQALSYLALRDGLSGTRPAFLLADQDTGLNGPLFSVADELGSSLLVVPHSGHPSTLLPHGRLVRVIERPGFGTTARTVLGQAIVAEPVRMQPRLPRQPRTAVRRICLMLNAIHAVGLNHFEISALASFHAALAGQCRAIGVELSVRTKPNAPAVCLLSSFLREDPQALIAHVSRPLPEVAAQSDICITFGEPTTGILPFLESGCLVLHVSPQRWPTDYLTCLPLIHAGVIPSLDGAAGVQYLHRMMVNPAAFAEASRLQGEAFELRAAPARADLFQG